MSSLVIPRRAFATALVPAAGLLGAGAQGWDLGFVAAPPSGQTIYNVANFPGANAGQKIQACINALPPAGGIADARSLPPSISIPDGLKINKPVRIEFGGQQAKLGGTILMEKASGAAIVGASASWAEDPQGTVFQWVGNATDPAFAMSSAYNCHLENFQVFVRPPHTLAAGVYMATDTGSWVSHNNVLENLVIHSDDWMLDKGVQLALGPGGDNNNDHMLFLHVSVFCYRTAAFSIEHTQSKLHTFVGCEANGGGVGKYGVTTALNNYTGGSFAWYGGMMSSNAEADFYLGQPDDVILISGGYSEQSTRLLETTGPSAGAWGVVVEGFIWGSANLPDDHNVIVYNERGALTLIGNNLGWANAPAQIFVGSTGPAAAVAIGNQIWTTLDQPFVGNDMTEWTLLGNMRSGPDGSGKPIPNHIP